MLLYLVNLFIRFLPESRCFTIKNFMWRQCGIKIGKDTRICSSVIFNTNNIVIGNGVWIGPGCRFIIASDTTCIIGDRVDIAMECLFVSGSHYLGDATRRAGRAKKADIHVADGAWVGARSLIMGGAKLGLGSVIGANSFCNTEVPKNTIVGGTPVSLIRALDD